MDLKFQVQLKIRKPVAQVFDAVVDHRKLSGYFIETATGPLAPGVTVMWKFPEFDESFPVTAREVVKDERVVFEWGSAVGEGLNAVEIVFKPLDGGNTLVQISETGWPETQAGITASQGNAGGWMHMLAAMKGSLEYGINLRAGGAF